MSNLWLLPTMIPFISGWQRPYCMRWAPDCFWQIDHVEFLGLSWGNCRCFTAILVWPADSGIIFALEIKIVSCFQLFRSSVFWQLCAFCLKDHLIDQLSWYSMGTLLSSGYWSRYEVERMSERKLKKISDSSALKSSCSTHLSKPVWSLKMTVPQQGFLSFGHCQVNEEGEGLDRANLIIDFSFIFEGSFFWV